MNQQGGEKNMSQFNYLKLCYSSTGLYAASTDAEVLVCLTLALAVVHFSQGIPGVKCDAIGEKSFVVSER
jgi:hypothetical protein